MRNPSSRRGSALLIVLGMLSFMIVSAVGFATYMRYSRLPSNFLRRSNSSRLLAKAAVAEAMKQVDLAVCNNFHPNVGSSYVNYDGRSLGNYNQVPQSNWKDALKNGSSANNRNAWRHRVLMNSGEAMKSMKPESDNVSPLCLEALAYIPPPLINDVRFYSRITPTTKWQSFGFDVGRYTFVAVDVSDYLDVNRLLANAPRSSSATRRVTLSYLFEENDKLSAQVEQWDKFLEKFRDYDENKGVIDFGNKFPLISLADFNLALGAKGGAVWKLASPFYDYVHNNRSALYNNSQVSISTHGPEYTLQGGETKYFRGYRRMTFVTDSYFPMDLTESITSGSGRNQQTTQEQKLFPLSDPKNQPFKMTDLKKGGRSIKLEDFFRGGGDIFSHISDDKVKKGLTRLSMLGCALLYDYLDEDHIPMSLAIPSVERIPMICGIEPKFTGVPKFSIQRKATAALGPVQDPNSADFGAEEVSPNVPERNAKVIVRYNIDPTSFVNPLVKGSLNTLVVFPFSHTDEDDEEFSMDGRFAFFFSSEKMSLRTGQENISKEKCLHLDGGKIDNTALMVNGLINFSLEDQDVRISDFSNKEEQEKALKLVRKNFANAMDVGSGLGMEGNALLEVTYEWKQTNGGIAGGMVGANQRWTPTWKELDKNKADYIVEAKCGFPFVKADGTVDEQFSDKEKLKGFITGGGKEIMMNAGAWLRVKEKDSGKVVDMVPACVLDDQNQNQINNNGPNVQNNMDQRYPLMRFGTGISFTLSINALDSIATYESHPGQPQPVQISPAAVMVADPRYNYAPEHWFQVAAGLDENTWLTNNKVGDGDRDGDISMATSDSGYLQSKYEFAHLPRLTRLLESGEGNMDNPRMGNLKCPDREERDYDNKFASFPTSVDQIANRDLMWRTYDPTDIDEEAFEQLPWTSEDTGFKVNPYTDSMNVMMAAFANTPIDWKRSSTNHTFGSMQYAKMSAKKFNEEEGYAFNMAQKADTKISREFLQQVAINLHDKIRDCAFKENQNWVEAWQQLDWSYHKDSFLGVKRDNETENLFVADRKFLYGYWRECFAAKQQLFLIFVRAEPMMMGGGAAGQIPPQLGARAMALVWRDPTPTKQIDSKYVPHQMRVLFYRQFE